MRNLLIFILYLGVSSGLLAQKFPPAPKNHLVSDFTGNTLNPSEIAQLEQKLVAYSDSTSTQIAVVIMPDIGGDDINLYTAELAQAWGVGRNKFDNGCMILLSMADRKVAIQNGYGLEPYLTDALSKRIIEQRMIPEFKQGNYYTGIDGAVDAIFEVLAGTFEGETYSEEDDIMPFIIFFIFIILIIFMISKNKNLQHHKHGGGYWIGGLGGRPYSGGFGSFGRGFGGGNSFGGFGGGSFGGGGASGSW